MKKILRGIAAMIVGILLVALIVIGMQEAVKIFKDMSNPQAHIDEMKAELNTLYTVYQSSDTAGKIGIAILTRDTFANEDTAEYPQMLQDFLKEVKAK